MAKRLIGSGVTDSNGSVTIPYTASGKGKLQIRAESGILESDLLELIDTYKYDNGIGEGNNYSDIWDNTVNITRRTAYSTIGNTTTDLGSILRYTTIPHEDLCVEFDIYTSNITSQSGSNWASIRYGTSGLISLNNTRMGMSEQTWYHMKIEVVDGLATLTNTTNGTVYNTSTPVDNYNRFYFRTGSFEYLAFRNWMMYFI